MLNLALWLKRYNFRLDQVQNFTPTPMAMATAMYHSGKNPLRKVTHDSEDVPVAKAGRVRKLHKAFVRYHDPANWPMLREALKSMGRADLIGPGKRQLVPAFQPAVIGSIKQSDGSTFKPKYNKSVFNKSKPSQPSTRSNGKSSAQRRSGSMPSAFNDFKNAARIVKKR